MFEKYEFLGDYKNSHLAKVKHDDDTLSRLHAWTTTPKNILYFCGKVGNGKTYFAAAYYNSLIEQKKQVRAYSEIHLFSELKQCMQISDWSPENRVKTIAETDYFILDDMGSTISSDPEKSEWKKEMLFTLLDLRYSSGLPTLITSNLVYKDLKKLFHERFASRLYAANNVIVELNGADRRKIIKDEDNNPRPSSPKG